MVYIVCSSDCPSKRRFCCIEGSRFCLAHNSIVIISRYTILIFLGKCSFICDFLVVWVCFVVVGFIHSLLVVRVRCFQGYLGLQICYLDWSVIYRVCAFLLWLCGLAAC